MPLITKPVTTYGLTEQAQIRAVDIVHQAGRMNFRAEIKAQYDQIPSLIAPAYQVMDGRVRALESWKERTDRDPVEIVRERWGTPRTT